MSEYVVLLLPGLDGTGELFKPLISCLPKRIKPVPVSYPRHECRTYEELKELVTPYIPKDIPFFVLGESFSGPLSIMIAMERSDGLKGLILCATFVKNPFFLLPSWMKFLSIGPIYRLWPSLIKIRTAVAGENYRPVAHMALAAIRSVDPAVIAHRVKSILSVNAEKELRLCSCPILYLMGKRDKLIKRHNYRRIKAVKNEVKLKTIDTGHFILQLEPERSSEILVEFMDSVKKNAQLGSDSFKTFN